MCIIESRAAEPDQPPLKSDAVFRLSLRSKGEVLMEKILVAESSEMDRSLLYEVFASQYELLHTDSSEEFVQMLVQYREELAAVLVEQALAERIPRESARTLVTLRIFENVPILLIVEKESDVVQRSKLPIPFSDVIGSPVNPIVAKKRVANLAAFFSNKKALEQVVTNQTKKILEQNRELKEQQRKINTINNDMLDTLSMVIEYRDVESGKHIHRIRKFTEVLLRILAEKYPKYQMTEDKIELITSASSMHDIGKIAIPDSILLSPRRLTYEEFRIMKQHTIKGCEILNQLDAVERNEYFRYCYDICRYHHEKWDGMGYPDGLVGDQIPIWAQVVSLADCYDALTSERPYKSAYSHEQAVEMIRTGACGAFSDEMLDCFSAALPKFRELAVRYADVANADKSISDSGRSKTVEQKRNDHLQDVYLKMDRNDLIETIEHLKKVQAEIQQEDREILCRLADYVFEFDLSGDMIHERKSSLKHICGFIPKNYEETVNVLAECCEVGYRSSFIKAFRLKNLHEKLSEGDERVILECRMDIGQEQRLPVRCVAIPVAAEKDQIGKVCFVISVLTGEGVNHRFDEDRDRVTGLWNYMGIRREVDDYVQNTGKSGYHALVMIDIDDFRTINRLAGYRFGNDILCDIANLLRYHVSGSNIIGRIEDDNFVIFINDCPDREQRSEIIRDIFRCIHKSYLFDGERTPDISASVGISLYPNDGTSFDELFAHAAKAVKTAKLNGKKMYLYYNSNMEENMAIKPFHTSLMVQERSEIEPAGMEEFFIPVAASAGGYILSYDMIGLNAEMVQRLTNGENPFTEETLNERTTALCLNRIRKLIAAVHGLEQENAALPAVSMNMAFDGDNTDTVVAAMEEMLSKYPVNCRHICLMLSHETVEQLSLSALTDLVGHLKGFGFRVGIYHVGVKSIHINCLAAGLFDRIDFARELIQAVEDGVYTQELLVMLMRCFDKSGAVCVLPSGMETALKDLLKEQVTPSFGYHTDEVISMEDFRRQMKASSVVHEYRALSHEPTALVLNEKMYEEILEQTRSFILEWSPRFDTIKLSGSFESLYGYQPVAEDFFRLLSESPMIHPDDKKKLMERMNAARSEALESEAFVRIYSRIDDDYRWNRVHFVTIRNATEIPVRVMAVFTDITDSRGDAVDEQRKDKTDFITNLYNKHAAENKIKSYLYEEGASSDHAFLIAEICGFEVLERDLGTVFANAVLKETAHNVRELFRDSDIIGRSSGSRFVVLIKGMSVRDKVQKKAEQICRVISNTYQSGTGEITVFGKIGISLFPSDGSTYDELYSAALKALYFAKHSPKNDIAFASDTNGSARLLHD